MNKFFLFAVGIGIFFSSCKEAPLYDTIIRDGVIYDGNGGIPYKADIGINKDTIAFIGDLQNAKAKKIVDANGKAIAPGFINMLSWATETLIEDGRSQSDIRQGNVHPRRMVILPGCWENMLERKK